MNPALPCALRTTTALVAPSLVRLALVMLALLAATSAANAACTPAATIAPLPAPGATVSCTGNTLQQNGNDGYGTGNQTGITVTVAPGASVTGNDAASGVGINIGSGAITNGAGSTVQGASGIQIFSGGGTVTNQGTIRGNTLIGIVVNGDATVINAATGDIAGVSPAINISGPAIVTNSGSISSSAANAINVNGTATVTNNSGGTIAGFGFGIESTGIASVTNSGVIRGQTESGIVSFNANLNVTNNAGGSIEGAKYALGAGALNPGGSTVFNAGTITGGSSGAIIFFGAGNVLTLAPGSSITGVVAGGSGNTLQLGGMGAASFDMSGVGAAAQYRDFTTLNKAGASVWTLTGASSFAGATDVQSGTLRAGSASAFSGASAFTVGSTLDLNGFDSSIGSLAGSATGVVTNNVAGGAGATLTAGIDNTSTTFAGILRNGTGRFGLTKVGTGTLTLTGANTYTGATTISGGTLALAAGGGIALSSGVAAFGTFDLSGLSNGGTSITTLSGSGAVNLGDNTLTITNGSGTFSGVIQDGGLAGGSVTVTGGLQILSGTNTYTGPTTVNGGSLRVNGSVAGDVTVDTGGTLSGIGAIGGAVDVRSGGTLSAGQSPGTLTLASLDLDAGSTSVFELGAPGIVGGASNDLVTVTGNLTLGGTLSVNAPSAGFYRLFNYGTLTAGSSFAAIAGSTNGTPTVLTNVPNQVSLSIAAAGQRIQFWDGADQTGNGAVDGGAGTWSAAGTNFTGAPGQAGFNEPWSGSVGLFAGAAGTVAVAGAQGFDTLQFGTTGYRLEPGGGGQLQLAGAAGTGTINTDGGVTATIALPIVDGVSQSLTKVGAGTLVLTGASTYSGGTAITGGTLQLGAGGTTGAILGDVTNIARLAFDRSDAVTFGGTISGTGAVDQIGAGTTTLSAANTYTGATTISGGTLVVAAGGGITSDVGNAATFANAGTVAGNLANTGTASNGGTIGGTVANAGGFTNAAGGSVGGRLTNSAGTTINAGTLAGGATITGGTLTTTGTIAGGVINDAVLDADGGVLNGAIANQAGTLTIGGIVSSDATLRNASGATLAIAGAGRYTLQGLLTNAGSVTIANGGALTATAGGIVNEAGGSLRVAAGGTLRDDLVNAGRVINDGTFVADIAGNTGTITNTGTWTGTVATTTGTLTNAGTWIGSIANAGRLTNAAGATISGPVTNSGAVLNDGTLSGGLTNLAGTVSNAGRIGGQTAVSGGLLTGSGALNNLSVSGGVFAPGDGTPGSSTRLDGALALQAAATYRVALDPATASFADVAGIATLGGATLDAVFANGGYIAKRYTLVNAAGGLSGTFGTLTSTNLPANFRSSLSYDATRATLDLALAFTPPPTGPAYAPLTLNQGNVAGALVRFFDTSGGIPTAFGALSPAGLAQVSGELGTASQQATFDAMTLFMGVMTDPSMAGRGVGAAMAGASAGPRDGAVALDRRGLPLVSRPWSLWAAGFGGAQSTAGNATLGSHLAASRVYATAMGLDYRLSPETIAGFAVAGGGTSFTLGQGSGAGRSDLIQAGAYLRHGAGPAYVSVALAYGWQDLTADRSVGTDRLRARFAADAFSGRIEGGYRVATPWLGLTPFAAAQIATYGLPAYGETARGAPSPFALTYADKDVTAARSELGLRSDTSFSLADGVVTLRGRAAWAHNIDPERTIAATIQALPGASFVVNGAAQARDAALVTGSAELTLQSGWAVAAAFEGEFSHLTRNYAGKGVVRYAW